MTKGVTKTKKLFIVILCCVVASLIVIAGGYTIYVQSHRAEAVEYLTEKYGFNDRDLILLDYRPSKFHDDTDLGVPFDWYYTSETWKFKCNGRIFGVLKSESCLSDDYQLEEIFDWSVNYLKSIDPNIVGIEINCGKLQDFIKQEEIASFLASKNSSFIVYYKVNNLDNYYSVLKNGFKLANDNFNVLNSKIIDKYHFINKDIENKGVILTNSNIEFSRNEYKNFASYYYDTEMSHDVLSKKGMTLQ